MNRKIKRQIKNLVSWGLAFITSLGICNILAGLYLYKPGWIDRDNAATTAIWNPGAFLWNCAEGFGYYQIDRNGYVNPSLPLIEKGYTLIIGSSYTQGKEVPEGKRYSDLLNKMLSDSKDSLCVYNVSQDGLFLPEIIAGFSALVQEFPNSDNIIIEIANTDYSKKELLNALVQRAFDINDIGMNIKSSLPFNENFRIYIKEIFPIATLIKRQIGTAMEMAEPDEGKTAGDNLKDTFDVVLAAIRAEYGGKVIIVYHPLTELSDEGGLIIKKSKSIELFSESCRKNNIIFLDLSDSFLQEYQMDYLVPYGFSNTTIGNGHFNCIGHKIMALELYKVLKGG